MAKKPSKTRKNRKKKQQKLQNKTFRVEQEEHYVAFLDILGYANVVDSATLEESNVYFEKVCLLMEDVVSDKYKNISTKYFEKLTFTDKFNPKFKLFSDNILISVKCSRNLDLNNEFYLLLMCVTIAIQNHSLSHHGILLRGGISRGLFVQNDLIAYGKALVSAYRLEREANYPRVLLESEDVMKLQADIENTSNNGLAQLLHQCILYDGTHYFLNNFMAWTRTKENFDNISHIASLEELETSQIVANTWKNNTVLRNITCFQLILIVNRDGKYSDVFDERSKIERKKVIDKLVWLLDYFNFACLTYTNLQHLVIDYTMIENLVVNAKEISINNSLQEGYNESIQKL